MSLRQDAEIIVEESIKAVLPDEAVRKVLEKKTFPEGRVFLVAVGKAAWKMASAAVEVLGERLEEGIVITKYQHVEGSIPRVTCYEGGHPVPDENGVRATEKVLDLTRDLKAEDTVIFLLSGGGSALFEQPLLSLERLMEVTGQLLSCGADIVEMNTIRKRLSQVKGGKFALHCAPAKIVSIVLSDVLGDPLDMIASGPACADSSTRDDVRRIVEKYKFSLSEEEERLLREETPKMISNVETVVSGSVTALCEAAAQACRRLGYKTVVLTSRLDCEAREAGRFLASIAKTYEGTKENLAFIAGGETVVHVRGEGKGGRNQEMALAAAEGISGMENVAFFSVGSDGTDGPTDAAGGYVDGRSRQRLEEKGGTIFGALRNNDAYEALRLCQGLIVTGPTGTNVNDVSVLLIRGRS